MIKFMINYVIFSTQMFQSPTIAMHNALKRKEIYKYEAPWPLYSMNWSVGPD